MRKVVNGGPIDFNVFILNDYGRIVIRSINLNIFFDVDSFWLKMVVELRLFHFIKLLRPWRSINFDIILFFNDLLELLDHRLKLLLACRKILIIFKGKAIRIVSGDLLKRNWSVNAVDHVIAEVRKWFVVRIRVVVVVHWNFSLGLMVWFHFKIGCVVWRSINFNVLIRIYLSGLVISMLILWSFLNWKVDMSLIEGNRFWR